MSSAFDGIQFQQVAGGLLYPEGPVWLPNGKLVVLEILGQQLQVLDPSDGRSLKTIKVPGGPNGAALGPNGLLYVCNDGGFQFQEIAGLQVPIQQSPTYIGGSVQQVDLAAGTVTGLYTTSGPNPLRAPDDIVFHSGGKFYFTDWGQTRLDERVRDITGIYCADPKGGSIQELAFPLSAPNGIGLSPDEKTLYVAETYSRMLLSWPLAADGTLTNPAFRTSVYKDFKGSLDSMALDVEGNIYVVTILPQGLNPHSNGLLTVVTPGGKLLAEIELAVPGGAFDPLPSNICFGGADRTQVYVTLGGSGRLITAKFPIPGRKLAF